MKMPRSFFTGYTRLVSPCSVFPSGTVTYATASFCLKGMDALQNSKQLLSSTKSLINEQYVTCRHLQRRFFCDQASATSFHVQDYEDFKERVLNADKPIVVDFFADWCGPCKLLAPRLESIVDSKGGDVLLAKVNVDDNTELAMEYGVRSVPTVIGFKDGQMVSQFVGLSEDEEIKSFLNNLANS